MKKITMLLLILPCLAQAQVKGGFQTNFSTNYYFGIGAELGYLSGSLYSGLEADVYLMRAKTNRSNPIFTQAVIGYKLNKVQPFLTLGYCSTGSESIRNHEGFSSPTVGGGLSYIHGSWKVSIAGRRFEITGPINENSKEVLKEGTYTEGIISFVIGDF